MKTIGIGIIGCGKIAQVRHIPEYADHPGARLLGFYDVNRERAQALAEQYGAATYDTVEALLANPEISAVSVCAINTAHAALSIQALEAGKDVLCEKPMATTIEDCKAMAEAARRTGHRLMIAQNQRLAEAHVKARKLLEEGAIGKVISFRTCFGHSGPESWSADPGKNVWFFDKSRAALGAMGDLGIHKTDLMQYLLGKPFVRVTARLAVLDKRNAAGEPISVEDNAFCIYETQDGIMGTMTASWSYYGAEDNSTVLYGSEGILRLYDDPAHPIVQMRKDGSKVLYDIGQIQTNDHQTKSGVIDLWMGCLLNGGETPISGEDELSAMRAVFAALESSEKGCTIEIKENML